MPGWLKALLIVAILVVLVVVGVVGAGVFWWMRNKDALMGRAKEIVAEGKDFGSHSDNQGCVDASWSCYNEVLFRGRVLSDSIYPKMCLSVATSATGLWYG